MSEFYERIETLLKEKKIKRIELAAAIGVTNQSFTDWKKRENVPAADVTVKIADYLGVSVDWLVTGKTKENFTKEELSMIMKYRELSSECQKEVNDFMDFKAKK